MDQDFPGSREVIRQAFLKKGAPGLATDAMLASLSDSTVAQYTKPLRLWWQFSREKGINFFSPSVSSVLAFLASFIPHAGSYSTLNTYRSAISLISSDEVGLHPLIKRFFKGIAVLKPQKPRYEFVWDPSPVIEYLASLFPYEGLPLELITKKLITLLALTTAQRMQTLASIQCSNIVISDALVIRIPARLKTSGIGRPQPLLTFRPFPDRPELCIFSLVNSYLELTRELRRDNCDSFFISYRKPHNSVSSQTLGRWVKSMLKAAGINTSIFSAHSTRHASTSLAASKGLNVEEIRRTAGWSKSSSVFARFYNKPIVRNTSFQAAILNA